MEGIFYMKRKIIVTGIIRCKDEYLVVQRSKDDEFLPGSWEFPGGNIEDGELILEALERELLEEIGVKFQTKSAKLVYFYDEIKENKEKYHYLELDFLIDIPKRIPIRLSFEHDHYDWVKKDSDLLDDYIKNKIINL